MRVFADENVARDLVDWLRSLEHDVLYAAESDPGESDGHWLGIAERERRVVVTSDKDFGELVFRDRLNSHGIILLRLGRLTVNDALDRVKKVWSTVQQHADGRIIVIAERRVRMRRLPG